MIPIRYVITTAIRLDITTRKGRKQWGRMEY